MSHPTAADYNEAIQNLDSLTGDDELRSGEVACNRLGLPMPYSGNFADVYQVRCTRRTLAVKCFTRGAPGLRQRYREISEHLKRVRLPFMVDFDYVEQGLRVNGAWQPLLKMQWVEGGLGLNQFVAQYLDRPNTLRQLLALWVKLSARLRQAEVAHADLQHGNVLLVPVAGSDQLSLKLIDYDGMHVPSLASRPSGELGHPSYQHPQRLRDVTYSGEVDRFSHLVIYCAVSSLLAGGRPLWERFDNRENLLFKEADFAAPAESELFQELWTLRDPQARALVGHLLLATRQPLDQVPLLEEIVVGGRVEPLTAQQERAAAALLVAGRRAAQSVAAGPNSTATGLATSADVGEASQPAAPTESASRSSSGTLPAWMRTDAATRPATADPPPQGTDANAAQQGVTPTDRSVPTRPTAPLAKLAGQGSYLRHPLLRVLAVVVPVAFLAIGITIAVRPEGTRPSSPDVTQATLTPRDEAELARDAWSAAWEALDRESLAKDEAASLASAEEKAALAGTLVQLEDFPEATVVYGDALGQLRGARAAMHQRQLKTAQDTWSTAWETADRDLLAEYAASALTAVEDKASQAATLVKEQDFGEAAVAYQQALSLLKEAGTQATAAKQLSDARDAWSTAWEGADRDLLAEYASESLSAIEAQATLAESLVGDKDFGEAAVAYGQALDLLSKAQQDIASPRAGRAIGPSPAIAPFDARQAAQHQQAWAKHLGTAVEVTNSIGMTLRLIPPGEFMMGSPAGEAGRSSDEGPEHRVRLTKPFYLGVYEVTQDEYERVMGTNPSYYSRTGSGSGRVSGQDTGGFPVERVSWEDAAEFCRKLSALSGEQSSGRVYRLPTEAEWEYACRAGTTTPFHFGSVLNGEQANFQSTLGRTASVGSYAANAFGLYDMHGNVWEWCSDWYARDYYGASPVDDPAGSATGSNRVVRGGSWIILARLCRAAYRDGYAPTNRNFSLGFRVASVPVDATGR